MDSGAVPMGTRVTAPEQLFTQAKDTFLLCISDEEKAQFAPCSSAEELVKSIATIFPNPEARGFSKMAKQISSFSRNLEPYFDVLGIFVQSHPEWAAIAWGAIQLVFKARSHRLVYAALVLLNRRPAS